MATIYDIFANEILLNSIMAIAIIVLGIFIGKLVSWILKEISSKLELNKKIRGSFLDLILVVIRWSIYIIFINVGLNQLQLSWLTSIFAKIFITVPAFTGALALLAIGFMIAVYLREVIEDAEVTGWDLISKIVFYFVLYTFGVYALKTALISFDEATTNLIILILTAVISSAVAYGYAKK